MADKKEKNTLLLPGVFIAGAVLGAVLVWLWYENENKIPEPISMFDEELFDASTLRKETVSRIPLSTENTSKAHTIVVPDQEAGGKVAIQYVSFESAGWVTIHELLPDDTLGNALGAQRFDPGQYAGSVSLLRVTEYGNRYSAVLYKDNGDKHFDLELDLPITDESGDPLQAKFNIVK